MKAHPEYEIKVNLKGQTVLIARLDRYGIGSDTKIIFGKEALEHLGCTQDEADRRVRAFHY